MVERQIGLLDCNNFFVSCERLFRPDLWKKPVAVLSSNDGCVVARSQEVKDLGIPMGVPYFKVRELCEKEGVVLFSSNFTLYRDISSRVMHVLSTLVPRVEVYSVDEAFFIPERSATEADIRGVQMTVERQTGIPVSIGVAPTKTLAKYASTKAKRGTKIHVLSMDEWHEDAHGVEVGTIWGIGRQHSAHLGALGAHTAAEFLALDPAVVRREFGVFGDRLRAELSGTPAFALLENAEPVRKSFTSSRSFKSATSDISVLESALTHHVAHLGEKLRARGAAATVVTVAIAPSRHGDYVLRRGSETLELAEPTNSTAELLRVALASLRRVHEPGVPYKKAGIALGGIIPESCRSTSLFTDRTEVSGRALDRVADALNARYGAGTVGYASALQSDAWRPSAVLRSHEYTTRWSHVPTVKAA